MKVKAWPGKLGGGRRGKRANGNGADGCAGLLMETVPLMMRTMRGLIEKEQGTELTVPQFRTLMIVHRSGTMSLSEAAKHLGLALPSASKLVDHLVKRTVLTRESDAVDRRRVVLKLTPRGDSLLRDAHTIVRRRLTMILQQMGSHELAVLHRTLELLQPIFAGSVQRDVKMPIKRELKTSRGR